MIATPMKWLGWALPSVAILAVAGMSILPSQTAHAQFDISGDWNLEIRSDLGATMCTAGVSQTGASFDMSVKCSGVTAGSLAGDIDLETGVFSGTGTLRARLIHFEGSALPAGNLIVGTWTTKPSGPAGTFVGTRPFVPFTPTPIPTPTPRPTLPAPVDLSGTWDLEFSSASGGGTCIALIEQANSDMAMLAACDLVGAIDLMGAIDPETGAFTIAGEGVVMEGLSAADGNSFSGAWAYFDLIAGALNGQRSDEIELIDLSGDWKLVTELDVGATCDAEFAHVWIELTAYVDCGELGSGAWTGTAHPLTGEFEVGGPLGATEVVLQGSLEGPAISGTWSSTDTRKPGWLIGVPSDQAHRGIIAVVCGFFAELQPRQCIAQVGRDVPVRVVALLPPASGSTGFQVELRVDGELLYVPSADPATEAIWPGCVAPTRDITTSESGESLTFSCHPEIVLSPDTAAGPLLDLTMACPPFALSQTALVLQPGDEGSGSGTLFALGQDAAVAPLLFNATMTCVVLPGARYADVNCDGVVNSIDAAFVLQYVSGLLDALPCPDLADPNFDGATTSIDAALILQYSAGLLVPIL